MATTARGFKRLSPFFIVGLILIYSGLIPEYLNAQSQGTPANTGIAKSSQVPYSTVALGPISPPAPLLKSQVSHSGAGLTIIPTFNSTGATSIDAATQTVINNAIAFYQNTFTDNITVNIEFHNMTSGLGQSTFFFFSIAYSTYCTALAANATSPDDMTALANTPCGPNNPANNTANIGVKSPNGRAVGLNLAEQPFPTNSSCPTPMFTGSGCIGLNVTLANSIGPGILFATVEHEIDEVLGLGSALQGTTTTSTPWPEDLFRWQPGPPVVRSYAANASGTNPCAMGTPLAFFSIDGGTHDLDDFNNCANGGDYGDWVTHTPSQVQDAFTNGTGTPALTVTSPEVRALDVIGYSLVSTKHRRGQLISQ
jgi:hypothetical protein